MAVETETAFDGCPLTRAQQTRNLVLFGINTSLIYLAGPVLYIGATQAALCKNLQAGELVANLPSTAYFAATILPVFVAWFLPYVRALKPVLFVCFGLSGLALLLVAATISRDNVSNPWKVASVIAQVAWSGFAVSTSVAFMWEVLGRGVADSRRGWALGLAFGAGPFIAMASSLLSQLIITGTVEVPAFDSQAGLVMQKVTIEPLPFPWNFATLYGLCGPALVLAAFLSLLFVIPRPETELVRQPFISGIFGGLAEFVTNPVLRTAMLVTFLAYAGNLIPTNMNLYIPEVLGTAPDQYAGYQNTLRFLFKGVTGLFLGWLLTRSSPRAGIVCTAGIYLSAMLWALFVTGKWYLLASGLHGAGELVGVYAPNYILSASAKHNMRRNMSFVTMIMAFTAPVGALFGWIAEHYGEVYSKSVGFRLSFAACGLMIAAGIVITLLYLPKRPPVRE